MKELILCAFATFATPGSVAQTSIEWSTPVDCNASDGGALRPRIALNGAGNPVVLWGVSEPNSNRVAVGNGTSFSAPVEVTSLGSEPAVAYWMGSSIAAVGNTVWIVMKAMLEETEPMYVRRSNDGGFTWGDTIRVDPYDGLVSRFPSIDVVDPDAPVVQYMQFDHGFAGARQVVTRMVNGAFLDPVQVSAPFATGDVCDCCPNQIVMDNDRAVALYRNAGSDQRVMWGAVSMDGGASFPTGALVDTTAWDLSICPSSGPDGYIAGDSIRYVWMSGANNGWKTYIGSARVDDLALGTQRFVYPGQSEGNQQNFPRIAGGGDTLGVVWENYGLSGGVDIFFSWSVTGLHGLSVPEMVNTSVNGTQRSPDIAYRNGAFHIVWDETAMDHVRYRKAMLINTTSIAEVAPSDVQLSPNPVNSILMISGSGHFDAEIVTLDGKVVLSSPRVGGTIDVSTLSRGDYLCRLSGPMGTRSIRFQKL